MQKLLNKTQAVFLGLASMLGAGVFVVFGPAASAAGSLLPVAVILAGLVAYLNAASIAQLSRVVQGSGGAYAYGRHYISKTAGFLAGAAFLIGKMGSVAAIALTVAHYLTPENQIFTAISAITIMTIVNILGINRTAFGAMVLVSITLSFLTLLIAASFAAPIASQPITVGEPFGVFSAAAFLFFAFAGYARVATLGGEVSNPAKTIPFAIALSLGLVFVIYLALALTTGRVLGASLGFTITPIADLAAISLPWLPSQVVAAVASIAALGSLLALLAGMGRTAATMAEDREVPEFLGLRNRLGAPWVAELAIAGIAILLVTVFEVGLNIGISSFAVLFYYSIANLAALKQPKSESNRPKVLNLLGFGLCIALALSVPVESLVTGIAGLAVLWSFRYLLARFHQSR